MLFFRKKAAMPRPIDGQLAVYMDESRYGQLLGILETLGPRRVLEWGAGGSTEAILRDVASIEKYVSIEDNSEWFERVKSTVRDSRLELILAPANRPCVVQVATSREERQLVREWKLAAEKQADIMAEYVAAAGDREFDAIIVDGRARNFCWAAGLNRLRPGGVLLLHDAERPEYHCLKDTRGTRLLPPATRGQLALFRKPD